MIKPDIWYNDCQVHTMDKRNIIFTTLSHAEAVLIQSLLSAHGIDVSVYDDGLSRMHSLFSSAIGGFKLVVQDDKIEEAQDILKEYREKEGQDPFCGSGSTIAMPTDQDDDDDTT